MKVGIFVLSINNKIILVQYILKIKMKNTFLLLLILFYTISLAQEVHVPFKIGKKFTISNDKGEFITDLKFDSIYFNDDLPKNYFYTLNDSKKGLFGKDKLIFTDLKGERLYFYKDILIIERIKNRFASDQNKENEEILYSSNGNRVFENQYKRIQIAPYESVGIKSDLTSNEIILFVQDFQDKTTIIIYDVNENKIVRTLLKEYYSIKRENSLSNSYYIKAKKNKEDTKTEDFLFFINNNSIQLIPFVEEKKKIGIENHEYDVVEAEPVYEIKDSKEEIKVKIGSTHIIQKKNKFYLVEIIDNKLDTVLIKLPRRIKDPLIVKTNFTIANDTVSLENETALSYTYRGNKGIYFNNLFELMPIYDSILPIVNHKNEHYFLLSKKENKKSKFGISAVFNQNIIPFEYDTLVIEDESIIVSFFKRYTYYEVVAKKNSMYGIITFENKEIIPFKYDFISRSKYYFYNTMLNGKHGFIKTYEYSDPILVEPVFTSKVKNFHKDYQSSTGFLLFELVDNNGNFKCFANKNGIEYISN